MKAMLKGLLMTTICFASAVSVFAADSVQNVISTTHTLNGYSNQTKISMSWDSAGSVNYFYAFNTSSSYTITEFEDDSTLKTSMQSEDFSDAVSQSSKSAVGYYFHIATKVGFGSVSATTTKGPYYIDSKAPDKVSLTAPETTNSQVVTLSLYADGANEMYLSNSGYGVGGSWESYATTHQWTLTEDYGTKTVYVLFKDAAGNESSQTDANSRTTIEYKANNAPQIKNLVAQSSGSAVSAPNLYFDIYDLEGGDITVSISSANVTVTDSDDITITGSSVSRSGSTSFTVTSVNADEDKALTLTILPASGAVTSTSSVITLTLQDAQGLTVAQTVTFNMTENLLIELSSFSVISKTDQNLIQWETSSEVDVVGFLLKRSESIDGPYETVSPFITAKGSTISGKKYEYEDGQIDAEKDYYYQLFEIDSEGNEFICSLKTALKRNGDENTDDDINYDANGDGDVNVGDVIYLLQMLTNFQNNEKGE